MVNALTGAMSRREALAGRPPGDSARWAATYVGLRQFAPVHCGRIISAGRGPGPKEGRKAFQKATRTVEEWAPGT